MATRTLWSRSSLMCWALGSGISLSFSSRVRTGRQGRLVMAGSSLTDPLPARLSREERPASRSALRCRRRSHRDGEAGVVCVAHCGADVRRAEAAGDKSGAPVVYSIPHRADVVASQVP